MILDEKHTDYPWPLSLIPRKWTAIKSDKPPVGMVWNPVQHAIDFAPYKVDVHLDVPVAGCWLIAFSRYGFMFSVNSHGWLFRVGTFRYDYVDRYYQIPTLTLKRHNS